MKCLSQFIDLISQEGRELTVGKKSLRESVIKTVGKRSTATATSGLSFVSVRTLSPTSDRLLLYS